MSALQTDLLDVRATWERRLPITIARLREHEPPDGYILAYSGGKDSDVLLSLARLAGVRYEAHYHATTIDPPEVVRHVREQDGVIIDRPKLSMVELIRRNGLPSRWRRWCCRKLKERVHPGRTVLTGIRGAESSRRAMRSMVEVSRRGKSQRFLHPMFDWSDADLWGYIEDMDIQLVGLYAEGRKRVGCVLCPLNPTPGDAERWPHIASAMRRAWLRFCDERRPDLRPDAEATWDRWICTGRATQEPEVDDGCPLFADVRDEVD